MWHMRELAFEKNLKIWKIKSTPVFYTFQLFSRAYLKANYLLITKRLLLNWRLGLLYVEKVNGGTFMVVQWLTLHLPMQGIRVRSLVRELRSHMPLPQKTKPWNRSNVVTNTTNTLKKKSQWNTILQSTIFQLKGKRKSWWDSIPGVAYWSSHTYWCLFTWKASKRADFQAPSQRLWFNRSGIEPENIISNQLLGDANAAGPSTRLCGTLAWMTQHSNSSIPFLKKVNYLTLKKVFELLLP